MTTYEDRTGELVRVSRTARRKPASSGQSDACGGAGGGRRR
jgi:hypothetical protein